MQVLVLEYGEPIGADAVKLVSKRVRWCNKPGKLYQRGKGGSNNSNARRPHYTKLLVEHAMSYGYLNGVKISKRGR